jgi:hypothetical protein
MKNIKENNRKKMSEKREEREKKDKVSEGLKLVIDMAKIKCNLCTNPQGILKVNFDAPTTQDKLTATVVEKDMKSLIFMGTCLKSPNSAAPCASVMKLGEWQDVGTLKVQDQFPLLGKSTIPCMYGGSTIEITDCGQRSEPASIDAKGAPVPKEEEVLVNGHFYNESDGTFEGKVEKATNPGSVNDVYTCTGKGRKKDIYNNIKLLELLSYKLSHSNLLIYAGIVHGEATNQNSIGVGIPEEELKLERYSLANAIHNYLKTRPENKRKISELPSGFSYAKKTQYACL